jgi:hypothetical protein
MTDDLQSVTVDVGAPTPDPIDNLSTKRERSPSERSIKQILAERDQERQARGQAERERDHARNEAAAARYHQHNAQVDGLLNAIGASAAEQDAAEKELETAYMGNDAAAIAKAQRKLSDASARKVQLEAQKQRFDAARQQTRQQPQRQMTIDDALANMPGLYGSEIDWLKSHPELVLDQAKNRRLTVYFDEAVERGLERGSPQFAQYLENRLGIGDRGHTNSRRDNAEPNYAAPVSRNGSGLDLDPSEMRGRVTLSPAQIDAARMAGISLDEYARQVLVLQARKRMGDYQ